MDGPFVEYTHDFDDKVRRHVGGVRHDVVPDQLHHLNDKMEKKKFF